MYRAEFNISALIIVLCLFVIAHIRQQMINTRMKLLYTMMICIAVSALSDLVMYSMIPGMDQLPFYARFVDFLGRIAYGALPSALFCYNDRMIHPYTRGKINALALYFIPFYITVVLRAVNMFIPFLYVVDLQPPYEATYAICIVYIVYMFYFAATVLTVLRHTEQISGKNLMATVMYLIMYAAGVYTENAMPQYGTKNFMFSLVLIVLVFNLQDDHALLDEEMDVLNRGCFKEVISARLAQSQQFYLLYMYVAGLEEYLDVLPFEQRREMADRLGTILKRSCEQRPCFRIGREVFVVCYEISEKQMAYKHAETFLHQMQEGCIREMDTGITPHFSVLNYPMELETPEDMLSAADYMMKRLKYDPEPEFPYKKIGIQLHNQKLKFGKYILEILKKNEYEVCYYPVYDTQQNEILGACASVRLKGGSSVEFSHYISEYGRLQGLLLFEDKMFHDVCKTVQKSDLISNGKAFIEVYFSDMQFMQGDFVNKVLSTLKEFHISTDRIRLCISEPVIASMNMTIERNLCAFSEAGIRFSLVNYGSGQSNFDRLNRLTFDTVEFDEKLVHSAGFDMREKEIVLNAQREALHRLGKKIRIYAEENTLAQKLSSDYTRSKAVSGEDFAFMLQKQTAIHSVKDRIRKAEQGEV